MKDILSEIIAHKQTEIELQKQTVSLEQLQEQAGIIIRENAAHRRSMKQALAASSTGIISEFKRRSPSKGWINEAARAEEIPASYEAAARPVRWSTSPSCAKTSSSTSTSFCKPAL